MNGPFDARLACFQLELAIGSYDDDEASGPFLVGALLIMNEVFGQEPSGYWIERLAESILPAGQLLLNDPNKSQLLPRLTGFPVAVAIVALKDPTVKDACQHLARSTERGDNCAFCRELAT